MSTTIQPAKETNGLAAAVVRKRSVPRFGAMALGPIVTIFVQVVTVPVLLHAWGIKLYDEWLIIEEVGATRREDQPFS